MSELSTRARAYLDAFAAEHVAPPAPAWVEPPARARTRWVVPLLAVAAVTVAAWRVAVTADVATETDAGKAFEAAPHRVEPEADPEPVQTLTPPPKPERRHARRPRPDVASATAREPELEADATPPLSAKPKRRAMARPAASSLRREVELIDRAKAALQRGDLEVARTALRRHRMRFPDGLLAPERGRLTKRIERETE